MKRTLVIAMLASLLAGGALSASAKPARHPYAAHLTKCHPALAAAARSLAVTASAGGGPTATRGVGIRLHLLVRHRGASTFTAYASPDAGVRLSDLGLDTWVKSETGRASLRYMKTINNLDARAAYRFRVGYRWYGRHGKVLRTRSTLTGTCYQPDMRPDLVVHRVTVTPVNARHDAYRVYVRNRGRTAAGSFQVTLALGNRPPFTRTVAGLAAHETKRVGFGPHAACDPIAPPVVTLDAQGVVDEANEANDVVSVTCP